MPLKADRPEEENAPRGELLTSKDLACRFQVHISTVHRWCDDGLITFLNLNLRRGGKRCPRFRREDVERFEEEHLVPGRKAAGSQNNR